MRQLIQHILIGIPLILDGNCHVVDPGELPGMGVGAAARQGILGEVVEVYLVVFEQAVQWALELAELVVPVVGEVEVVVGETQAQDALAAGL